MQVTRVVSRALLCGPSRVAVRARAYTVAAQTTPVKIPMSLIQDLRNRTGAGVSDCKKALEINHSDIANATSWLREKGKLTATKLAGRVAGEGVIALAYKGGNAVIIEMNSETDFVSRGASFRNLSHKIVDQSLLNPSIIPKNAINPIDTDSICKLPVEVEHDEPGQPPVKIPVQEAITRTITKTKENIKVRRAFGISSDQGVVGGYIHGGEGDTKAGRMGALVTLVSSSNDTTALSQLATQLAMHVVGLNPKTIEGDSNVVATEQSDDALLDQKFFSGEGETVRDTLAAAGARLGAPVRVHSFVRLVVGEGIEKKQEDFAQEVMGMVKQ